MVFGGDVMQGDRVCDLVFSTCAFCSLEEELGRGRMNECGFFFLFFGGVVGW